MIFYCYFCLNYYWKIGILEIMVNYIEITSYFIIKNGCAFFQFLLFFIFMVSIITKFYHLLNVFPFQITKIFKQKFQYKSHSGIFNFLVKHNLFPKTQKNV